MRINTNTEKIDEFLTRGVENIYPSKDFVKKQLLVLTQPAQHFI
jgi:hypothetical protein